MDAPLVIADARDFANLLRSDDFADIRFQKSPDFSARPYFIFTFETRFVSANSNNRGREKSGVEIASFAPQNV